MAMINGIFLPCPECTDPVMDLIRRFRKCHEEMETWKQRWNDLKSRLDRRKEILGSDYDHDCMCYAAECGHIMKIMDELEHDCIDKKV